MDFQPTLPIPISYISARYLLFSIDAVTYLRREHNICGVLIGTLPQIPQQNVFLGLPLELMPEEARVLVDKGVACIVDEAKAHNGMQSLLEEDRRQYLRELESQGLHAARIMREQKDRKKEAHFKTISEQKAKAQAKKQAKKSAEGQEESSSTAKDEPASLGDFFTGDTSSQTTAASANADPPLKAMGVTPATSYPPLPHPSTTPENLLWKPRVPLSYPLYAHLHSRGFFLSPGLRFGCQYVAYPGDPLRFHSHFLVSSVEWDEEINLMDIVNGGRLGTGVKKGFLLGGSQKPVAQDGSQIERTESVRTFSIEWAGM